MSAFSRLVVEGKKACEALARATPWSREEWARSIRTLERAGLFPEIGLEQVVGIAQKTNVPPDDVARMLVEQAEQVIRNEAQKRVNEAGGGSIPPSLLELKEKGHDLTPYLQLPAGSRVVLMPSEHEKTTVCHARHRDYPAAPHLHDCRRLAHDDEERTRPHECACGGIW